MNARMTLNRYLTHLKNSIHMIRKNNPPEKTLMLEPKQSEETQATQVNNF